MALVAAFLPVAALILAVTLVIAALAAPAVAIGLSRREEREVAPRRGDLAAATIELLDGAAELAAFGAADRALAAVAEKERAVADAAARSGYAKGAGAAMAALACGAAVWGAVFFGVPAVRAGTLAAVLLGVVVLTPLAAHEVFAGLAPAAVEVPRLRAAAARVTEMVSRPSPVAGPRSAASLPGPPYDLVVRGLSAGLGARRTGAAGRVVHRAGGITGGRGGAVRVGEDDARDDLPSLPRLLIGRGDSRGRRIRSLPPDAVRSVIGLCEQDAHVFDTTLAANLRLAKPSA